MDQDLAQAIIDATTFELDLIQERLAVIEQWLGIAPAPRPASGGFGPCQACIHHEPKP